jgi:hypothetical protein
MSVNPISSSQCNCNSQIDRVRQFQGDPAKRLDALIQRFLKKTDTDGNGTLSNQELSGLSSDDFSKLDSDGDGQISADEIKAAAQKLRDSFKQAVQNGQDPKSVFESLKDTPEGKLLGLLRPGRHHGPPPAPNANNNTQSGSQGYSISTTSISISITSTTLNVTA